MPIVSKNTPDDVVMLENIMKATGLPRELAQELLCADAELDSQCEATLFDLKLERDKDSG